MTHKYIQKIFHNSQTDDYSYFCSIDTSKRWVAKFVEMMRLSPLDFKIHPEDIPWGGLEEFNRHIFNLIKYRCQRKKAKDYESSDFIRGFLTSYDIQVRDSNNQTEWEYPFYPPYSPCWGIRKSIHFVDNQLIVI